MREEIAIFATALRFCTRLPLFRNTDHTAARFAASARYYPVVGLLVGALLAAIWYGLAALFPQPVAALLIVALGVLLTGALHEDGFADLCDGLGAGGDKARTLEIMRDSRLGCYGAIGLILLIGFKILALGLLAPAAVPLALVLLHGLSRLSLFLAILMGRPAIDDGLGKAAEQVGGKAVQFGFAVVYVAAFACLIRAGFGEGALVSIAVALAFFHGLIRFLYERRLGGYTGDCLGGLQQMGEAAVLLGLLACL
ncbi:MAG: adenosylcobinamide-GDP ribazoletransferase [Rhodospirillales bacterium]|nr:adenosylcobinamide-GDP ribazoletransferase [Rhodospirillales bacterium]